MVLTEEGKDDIISNVAAIQNSERQKKLLKKFQKTVDNENQIWYIVKAASNEATQQNLDN